MARWTTSCANSPSRPAAPTSRRSFSAPPVRQRKTHDRRAAVFADAVDQEPPAPASAPVEKTQVPGRGGRRRRLFLFLFLPQPFGRTPRRGRPFVAGNITAVRTAGRAGIVSHGPVGLGFSARTGRAAV